jgi:hypothetical protein
MASSDSRTRISPPSTKPVAKSVIGSEHHGKVLLQRWPSWTQQEGGGRRRNALSSAQTLPTASRCPAGQPQRTRFAAGTAIFNQEKVKNQPGGSRHKPLLAARARPRSEMSAVDVAARSGAQPYPLLAAAAGQPQVSRFAAEVGTRRSSPLARARLSGEAAVFVGALIPSMI